MKLGTLILDSESHLVSPPKTLLAIVELGGYADFTPLYKRVGYHVVVENTMRKALAYLKKYSPDVIVAEFNYQSAFRDRVSSLESLVAVVERRPAIRVIVFFDLEFRHQYERLRTQYAFFDEMPYPIDPARLELILRRAG
jgi:DNA-binding NtrC family response regulator